MQSAATIVPPSTTPRRLFVVETWIGVWMASYVLLMLVKDSDSAAALFAPLAVAAVAMLFITLRMPSKSTPSSPARFGAGMLLIAIIASYLINTDRYDIVFIAGNVVSAILLFFVATSISSRFDVDYRRVFVVQAVLICLMLPVILAQGSMVWGRLVPRGTTPNYVGMVALTCVIGAVGARAWALRLTLLATSLLTIVLVSSRASILAAGLTIGIAAVVPLLRLSPRQRGAVLGLGATGLGALAVLSMMPGMPFSSLVGDVVEGLLKVNDPYRGISSGGSGRSELWEAAIGLWQSSPVFGVGFKGHQQFMPFQQLAHNAYLGLLADCGVVGLAGYLLICVAAVIGLRIRPGADRWARFILVATYLIYGFVESRAFGFGNPYSIVFVLIAFDGGKVLLHRAPVPTAAHAVDGPLPLSFHAVRS